jgi:hypothetical protein
MRFQVFTAMKTNTVIFCAMAESSQYFTGKTLLPSFRCKQMETVCTPQTWILTHHATRFIAHRTTIHVFNYFKVLS